MQGLQHLAGHLPHISAAMPVFKLCGSQLSQENLTAGDSIRVFQVRSKGVPEPVDDLGAALHTHLLPVRQLDVVLLGVVGLHPNGLTDRNNRIK